MDLTEKTENLKRHPWELSRSYNILKLLPRNNNLIYADVGAGDKYFTSKLLSITGEKVFAIDNEYKNAGTEHDGIISLNNVCHLQNNSIDCLIMMDVLEHIENETIFLHDVFDKLKPNGNIIITVPAMQFLFSSHDVFLKHHRRYNRKQLMNLLRKHDIHIEQSYYFYSTLFIVRCISSLLEKLKPEKENLNVGIGLWKHDEKSFITRSLFIMLNIDFFFNKIFNKIHIRLPGLSLIAVCRKNT